MAQGQSHATATHTLGWCPSSQVNPGLGSPLWNKWCQACDKKSLNLNQLMLNHDYHCNMIEICGFLMSGQINASLMKFFWEMHYNLCVKMDRENIVTECATCGCSGNGFNEYGPSDH